MDKEGLIFTDIDGTIVFHEDQHGIKPRQKLETGNVIVLDPASGSQHEAIPLPTELYQVFMDIRTKALLVSLSGRFDIALVTGARKSTIEGRRKTLNFQKNTIIENGASILDKDLLPDQDWENIMKKERVFLPIMIRELETRGIKLDIKGRNSAIRIRHKDNPQYDEIGFEQLYQTLELPLSLKKTKNLGHIDIILRSAGKGNAVRFLCDKLDYPLSQTAGIGDDLNDLEMLREVAHRFVLGNAFPEAIEAATREGMTISKGKYFNGINEILDQIAKINF